MNQHQITMTAGDDRTFSFTVDSEWEGASAKLLVDNLFTKTGTVGADDGSGYSTVSVTVDVDDVGAYYRHRRAYRYALELSLLGETRTVYQGLFVVLPDVEEV